LSCVQVRLAKPQPTTYTNDNNNSDQQVALPGANHPHYSNTSAAHLQPSQPEYIPADDGEPGTTLCRWQIDVSGYQPSDINVKVDGGKLLVSARRADVKGADNSSSSELSKRMDIPRDVIHDEMTSYMTRDGLLVVQAPVTPCHMTPQRSGVKMAAVNGDCHFRPIDLPPEQPPSDDVIAASRRHVVKTGDKITTCIGCRKPITRPRAQSILAVNYW